MIKVTTTIQGADIGQRNVKRAMRVSEDFALKFHRHKFMPLHFKPVARVRYGAAYKKTPGKYSRRSGVTTKKNGQGRRDVERERRMNRSVSQSTQSESGSNARKRPVFDSGLTELKVLRGGFKATGRFDKRGVTYNVPFYIKINPAGQLNKVRALNAIHPQEETKLASLVEQKFIKELEKKQTKKRG